MFDVINEDFVQLVSNPSQNPILKVWTKDEL